VTNDLLFPELFPDEKPDLVAAFWKYHAENPQIYNLVDRFTNEALAKGGRSDDSPAWKVFMVRLSVRRVQDLASIAPPARAGGRLVSEPCWWP